MYYSILIFSNEEISRCCFQRLIQFSNFQTRCPPTYTQLTSVTSLKLFFSEINSQNLPAPLFWSSSSETFHDCGPLSSFQLPDTSRMSDLIRKSKPSTCSHDLPHSHPPWSEWRNFSLNRRPATGITHTPLDWSHSYLSGPTYFKSFFPRNRSTDETQLYLSRKPNITLLSKTKQL